MQIGAGASAGRPVGAGRLTGGDPATSGALRSTRGGRREGRRGKTLPAEPLPPLPPPGRRRDNARPLFRRGLGRGGRIRARAFRPQGQPPPALAPPAPAPRRPHTGGFPLGRGRPRHFYITIELCAPGMRLLAAAAPARPRLHPVPGQSARRRLGGTRRAGLVGTSPVTCGPCRAAETFSATPSPPCEPGVSAGSPPRPSPTPGRDGTPESSVWLRTPPQGRPTPRTS